MKTKLAAVLAGALLVAACQTQPDPDRVLFVWRYSAWLDEAKRISSSTRTADYLALPSFRAIEKIGPPVVPYIQSLLEDGKCERPPDFLLAHALIAIRGWNEQEFAVAGSSEQALCRRVLERLKA